MLREFRLPDLGEGVHEGEIRAVLVATGDSVHEDQPVLEVETDKVTVEMTSPYAGVVQDVNVAPGQVARVGDILMTFAVPEPAAADEGSTTAAAHSAALQEGVQDNARGDDKAPPPGHAGAGTPAPGSADVPQTQSVAGSAGVPPAAVPAVGNGWRTRTRPVPATPATRRVARELGVDLRAVPPSGPGGRVSAEDVRAFAEHQGAATATAAIAEVIAPPAEPAPVLSPSPTPSSAPAPAPAAAPALPNFAAFGPVERVRLASVKRASARHLALAWSQIPHVHHMDQADVTALEDYRQRYKGEIEAQGGRLSLTVFALKAASVALREFPNFNASYDAAEEEVILKRYYHLGVATDTERGLVVPVIRDVDRKSILVLAVELAQLGERVRAGKASADDMRGGTFTITNPGPLGGTGATPIINYPEAAILGMGAARWQPAVVAIPGEEGGQKIVPRLILPVFLGFDHRVADGVDAARFVRRVVDILENPDRLALVI